MVAYCAEQQVCLVYPQCPLYVCARTFDHVTPTGSPEIAVAEFPWIMLTSKLRPNA